LKSCLIVHLKSMLLRRYPLPFSYKIHLLVVTTAVHPISTRAFDMAADSVAMLTLVTGGLTAIQTPAA